MARGNKTILKAALAVLLLGILIFFSNVGLVKSLRGGLVKLFKPLVSLTKKINRGSASLSEEEVLRLLRENQHLKQINFDYEKLKEENSSLKKALGFRSEKGLSLKGVRVLLYAKEAGQEFLLVDQGRETGIRKGDAVLNNSGMLVGFVSEIENDYAKVMLASNPDKNFEVVILPSHVRALAKGLGGRALALELIPEDTSVGSGDFVSIDLRSANGIRYNFLLGEVTREKRRQGSVFKDARARLMVDPAMLDEVFILSLAI